MTIAEQLKQTPAFRGSCAFLSNFAMYLPEEYHTDPYVDTIKYPSNEHFYQAYKFMNANTRELVSKHPLKGLKAYCRSIRGMRTDWDEIKDMVMRKGLEHKFSFQRFSDQLIGTQPYELVETNTWGDIYWGVCNGVGQNRLGKMLMEVRAKI